MKKIKGSLVGVAIMLVIIGGSSSCRPKKDDSKKYDSLFLGVSMGMERKAFFDYCWKMNNQKIFKHGPTNTSVEYRLGGVLDDTVRMQFYPSFDEEKIYEVPVLFSYETWAPWNKQYSADTLFVKMLPVLKKWYGSDFKVLNHETMGKVYYKMDGRRRINYFIRDDQFVQLVFTDLKVEKKLKDAEAKPVNN